MYNNKQPAKRIAKVSSKLEKDDAPEIINWIDKLNQAIEDLSESHAGTREISLETIVDLFSTHRVGSHIEFRVEEILGLFKRSITKNASAKEACLAARAIALVFINLDDISETDGDDLYRRILPCLRNTIKDGEQVEIKINCLHTLSLITFIAASDIDKKLVRDYVFDLIETDAADFNVETLSSQDLDSLMDEALRSYGVLYASSFSAGVVDFDVLWEEVEKVMPIHEILLESPDKDIRISAGENIGLMFETVNIFLAADDDDEDEDTVKPEYDNMDGLIHTLKDLSVDNNRRRAKSDRAETKSIFRDVLKSVEENIKPVEELKINRRTLSFRGWAKILPLNSFRKSLGKGFQHHLKTNSMLKVIFNYSLGHSLADSDDSDDSDHQDVSERSNVDRKYIYADNKKSRSKHIRSARLGKENPDIVTG